MTHPLTPREKVAAVVLDAAAVYLIQQYGASHGLDHEVDRARIMSAIPNDAILTALASGSGDHAELARLAEAAKKGGECLADAVRTLRAFHAAANPATVLALLAENAALRAERDEWRNAVRFNERCWSEERGVMIDRAAEAERKLAEAVADKDAAFERLDAEINQHGDTTERLAEAVGLLRDFLPWSRKFPDLKGRITTFLSKEAERG